MSLPVTIITCGGIDDIECSYYTCSMHYYSKLFSTNVEVYDIAVHICCCGVALLQAGLAIILCSITESLPGYKYCRSVAFLQAGI